jgi:hypothetical protein
VPLLPLVELLLLRLRRLRLVVAGAVAVAGDGDGDGAGWGRAAWALPVLPLLAAGSAPSPSSVARQSSERMA